MTKLPLSPSPHETRLPTCAHHMRFVNFTILLLYATDSKLGNGDAGDPKSQGHLTPTFWPCCQLLSGSESVSQCFEVEICNALRSLCILKMTFSELVS